MYNERGRSLGIRSAVNMNKALIAKVGWRLLQDEESLWARVVRKKYKVGNTHERAWLAVKSNWSAVWRSVVLGLREVVFPGHCWVIGDGKRIKFWTDKWLSGQPLAEKAIIALPENHNMLLVSDLWSHEQGWCLEHMSPYVSESTILELRYVVLDCVTGARDRISWSMSAGGVFSVKSAYSMLTFNGLPQPDMESFFRQVWSVKAPERVRVFLWLVSNQVIMTNAERKRRHLSDTDVCMVCKGGFETILHVLRDCPAMLGIWQRIVPARMRQRFFSGTLLEWVYENLKEGLKINNVAWATTFAMAVWWSWKWRCGNIFGENGRCPDRVRFIKNLAQEV